MKRQWISVATAFVLMATPVASMAATPTAKATPVKATVTQKAPAKTAEVKLPSFAGNFENIIWVNETQVIGALEEEAGTAYYLIDTAAKTSKKIVGAELEAAELAVSPDGQYAAFVGKEGDLALITLATGQQAKITETTDAKTELTWTADSSKLFYLMGEKIDQVAAYSLKDKTTTVVVADKVQFKGDLSVSKDGNVLAYSVTPAGKTDEAAGFTVDTKNTEPQIYFFNTKAEKPAAALVTAGTDNKLFGQFTADGSYLYVSADTENKSNSSEIRKISADGKSNVVLYGGMYVTSLKVTGSDEIFFTGTDLAGGNTQVKLRTLDAKGLATPVAVLEDNVSDLSIAGGKKIAGLVDLDGKQVIGLLDGSKFTVTTK